MKLVWHVIRKDLVRLRWWLLAWIAVLALPIFIGVEFTFHRRLELGGIRLADVVRTLDMLEIGLGWLLTIVLVQGDALVGSRQFWLTRPISGTRMLAAKAGGLVVILGAIPVLVALPWWLWCGLDARAIAVAAVESCAVAAAVGAPAALVAAFTDSLARALLWTLVVVAFVLFGGFFFGWVAATTLVRDASDTSLSISRGVVAFGSLAIEFGLFAGLFYVVRRRWALLTMMVPMVLLTVPIASRSTWRIFPEEPQLLEPHRADGIEVRLAHAWTEHIFSSARSPVGQPLYHEVEALFSTDHVPAGTILLGVAARYTWRWPDGASVERTTLAETYFDQSWAFANTLGFKLPGPDPETAAWWQQDLDTFRTRSMAARRDGTPPPRLHLPPESAGAKMPESPLVLASVANGNTFTVGGTAWVTPSLALKMMSTPADFEARLWLGVMRPRLSFEMPLQPGPWHYGTGGRMRIATVERQGDAATVMFTATRAGSLWEILRMNAVRHGWWDWGYTLAMRTGPVVVNRARGELHQEWRRVATPLVVTGVEIDWERLAVSGGNVMRSGKLVPWPGWLDGASLAVLTMEPEAVFARDVKVPDLRVEEISRATDP
jgi:hypothetical protein